MMEGASSARTATAALTAAAGDDTEDDKDQWVTASSSASSSRSSSFASSSLSTFSQNSTVRGGEGETEGGEFGDKIELLTAAVTSPVPRGTRSSPSPLSSPKRQTSSPAFGNRSDTAVSRSEAQPLSLPPLEESVAAEDAAEPHFGPSAEVEPNKSDSDTKSAKGVANVLPFSPSSPSPPSMSTTAAPPSVPVQSGADTARASTKESHTSPAAPRQLPSPLPGTEPGIVSPDVQEDNAATEKFVVIRDGEKVDCAKPRDNAVENPQKSAIEQGTKESVPALTPLLAIQPRPLQLTPPRTVTPVDVADLSHTERASSRTAGTPSVAVSPPDDSDLSGSASENEGGDRGSGGVQGQGSATPKDQHPASRPFQECRPVGSHREGAPANPYKPARPSISHDDTHKSSWADSPSPQRRSGNSPHLPSPRHHHAPSGAHPPSSLVGASAATPSPTTRRHRGRMTLSTGAVTPSIEVEVSATAQILEVASTCSSSALSSPLSSSQAEKISNFSNSSGDEGVRVGRDGDRTKGQARLRQPRAVQRPHNSTKALWSDVQPPALFPLSEDDEESERHEESNEERARGARHSRSPPSSAPQRPTERERSGKVTESDDDAVGVTRFGTTRKVCEAASAQRAAEGVGPVVKAQRASAAQVALHAEEMPKTASMETGIGFSHSPSHAGALSARSSAFSASNSLAAHKRNPNPHGDRTASIPPTSPSPSPDRSEAERSSASSAAALTPFAQAWRGTPNTASIIPANAGGSTVYAASSASTVAPSTAAGAGTTSGVADSILYSDDSTTHFPTTLNAKRGYQVPPLSFATSSYGYPATSGTRVNSHGPTPLVGGAPLMRGNDAVLQPINFNVTAGGGSGISLSDSSRNSPYMQTMTTLRSARPGHAGPSGDGADGFTYGGPLTLQMAEFAATSVSSVPWSDDFMKRTTERAEQRRRQSPTAGAEDSSSSHRMSSSYLYSYSYSTSSRSRSRDSFSSTDTHTRRARREAATTGKLPDAAPFLELTAYEEVTQPTDGEGGAKRWRRCWWHLCNRSKHLLMQRTSRTEVRLVPRRGGRHPTESVSRSNNFHSICDTERPDRASGRRVRRLSSSMDEESAWHDEGDSSEGERSPHADTRTGVTGNTEGDLSGRADVEISVVSHVSQRGAAEGADSGVDGGQSRGEDDNNAGSPGSRGVDTGTQASLSVGSGTEGRRENGDTDTQLGTPEDNSVRAAAQITEEEEHRLAAHATTAAFSDQLTTREDSGAIIVSEDVDAVVDDASGSLDNEIAQTREESVSGTTHLSALLETEEELEAKERLPGVTDWAEGADAGPDPRTPKDTALDDTSSAQPSTQEQDEVVPWFSGDEKPEQTNEVRETSWPGVLPPSGVEDPSAEEPPRLFAWDAEPPFSSLIDGDGQQGAVEQLRAQLQAEATAAAEAAQTVLYETIRELMMHLPRQCLLVEVCGLRQWCREMLCSPRLSLPLSDKGAPPAIGGTRQALDEAWRRAVMGGVEANAMEEEEDPSWIQVRLSLYAHDGEDVRLLASGFPFTLPANFAALDRCQGYRRGSEACGGDIGKDGAALFSNTIEGYGRDSWSDLLIFRGSEAAEAREGEATPVRKRPATECEVFRAGAACKSDDDGGTTVSSSTSISHEKAERSALAGVGCGMLYLHLEERWERWVPTQISGGDHDFPGKRDGTATSVPSRGRDASTLPLAILEEPERQSAPSTPEHNALGSESRSSVEWQTETSSSSSTRMAAVPLLSPAPFVAGDSSAGVEESPAHAEAPHACDHSAVSTSVTLGLHLEERWRPLAVSSRLQIAELCGLSPRQPSLCTTLAAQVPPVAPTVSSEQRPRLPCRMRIAQEPQASLDYATAPIPGWAAWRALGTAVEEYERMRRCAVLGAEAVDAAMDSKDGAGRCGAGTPPPLTVLWNTILPSVAAALQHASSHRSPGESTAAPGIAASARMRGAGRGWPMQRARWARKSQSACSVRVRGAVAFLFPDVVETVSPGPYHPPTALSVTGGNGGMFTCTNSGDGVTGTNANSSTARVVNDARVPVMQYSISFQTTLTAHAASTLLFTVHGLVSPEKVFGFAVWSPLEAPPAASPLLGRPSWGRGNSGGVTDVWLPLLNPAVATVAPPLLCRQGLGTAAAAPTSAAAAVSSPAFGAATGGIEGYNGLTLAGWLHCDVEVVCLPSVTEAAVQQLWHGSRQSLTSLACTSVKPVHDDQSPFPWYEEDSLADFEGALLDLTVVKAAGLRPPRSRGGLPIPPTPLRWDDPANWSAKDCCAQVYCEVVALSQPQAQRRHQRSASTNSRRASSAFDVVSTATSSARPFKEGVVTSDGGGGTRGGEKLALFAVKEPNFASEVNQRGGIGMIGGQQHTDGSKRAEHGGGWGEGKPSMRLGATPSLTRPPVTAAVTHTNNPRWEHRFRCGVTSLAGLHLRVFDLAPGVGCRDEDPSSDGRDGDRTASLPTNEKDVSSRHSSSGGSHVTTLLGNVTLSRFLLQRFIASGEGSAWLPLLWSPGATTGMAATSAAARGRNVWQPSLSGGCSGFVLVRWRRCFPELRASPQLSPSLLQALSLNSWHACETRRLWFSSEGAVSAATAAGRLDVSRFPHKWCQPTAPPSVASASPGTVRAYRQDLGWMCPELTPLLWMRQVRLRWVWLQHFLFIQGGQARLKIGYVGAAGEMHQLEQYELVPLHELAGARSRHRCTGEDDAAGTWGMVRSAPSGTPYARLRSADPGGRGVQMGEADLCLPATPRMQVQVWWYPIDKANGNVGSSSTSPRMIGHGEWCFPEEEVSAELLAIATGNIADVARGPTLLSADDQSEEDAHLSGVAAATAPCDTTLRTFFTPHEMALHLAPVQGTNLPRHTEGGVLSAVLSSLPRLLCKGWGATSPTAHAVSAQSNMHMAESYTRLPHALRDPPHLSQWAWPEGGPLGMLRMQVHHVVWLDRTDAPDSETDGGASALQIVVSGTTTEGAPPVTRPTAEPMASVTWVDPEEVPPADAPRVLYPSHGIYATRSYSGAAMSASSAASNFPDQALQSSAQWVPFLSSAQPTLTPRGTASVGSEEATNAIRSTHAAQSGAIEVRWPHRNLVCPDSAAPCVSVWLVTPPPLLVSDDVQACADAGACGRSCKEEKVWAAVTLPGLMALSDNAGALWLPLFRSYAMPAASASPSNATGTPPSPLSGNGGGDSVTHSIERNALAGEGGDVDASSTIRSSASIPSEAPDLLAHAVQGDTRSGPSPASLSVAKREGASAAAAAAAPPLRAPFHPPRPSRTPALVRHVGFAAVQYAHNFRRETTVAAAAAKGPTKSRQPLADVPSETSRDTGVLLVQVGPMRCRDSFWWTRHGGRLSSPSASPSSSAVRAPSQEDIAAAVMPPLSPPFPEAPTPSSSTSETSSASFNEVGAPKGAEVLLGFEGHQVSVRLGCGQTPCVPPDNIGSDVHNLGVLPLEGKKTTGGGHAIDSRQVLRLQVCVAAMTEFVGNAIVLEIDRAADRCEGAQWVPLLHAHHPCRTCADDDKGEGTDVQQRGEFLVGEILVRWIALKHLPVVGRSSSPASTQTPLQLLVREFCGGAGASCTYAVLPKLSASLPMSTHGSRSASVTGLEGLAYPRGTEDEGTSLTTPSASAALALSHMLRAVRPRQHPCVYLVLDDFSLQCGEQLLRAWRATSDDAAAAGIACRLQAKLIWPPEWEAAWLQMALQLQSGDGSPTAETAPHPPVLPPSFLEVSPVSLSVWVDCADVIFKEGLPSSAAAEHRLTNALPMSLCLPLPTAQRITLALGAAGLASRLQIELRLLALPLQSSTGSPNANTAALDAAAFCVGTGQTFLPYPQSTQYGITLLSPAADGAGSAPAAPSSADGKGGAADAFVSHSALLHWRARVAVNMPVSSSAARGGSIHGSRSGALSRGGGGTDDGMASLMSWNTLSGGLSPSGERGPLRALERTSSDASAGVLSAASVLISITVERIEIYGLDVCAAGVASHPRSGVAPPATVALVSAPSTLEEPTALNAAWGSTGVASTVTNGFHLLAPHFAFPEVNSSAAATDARAVPEAGSQLRVRQPPRYHWSTDLSVAPSSQLVFYVGVVSAALLGMGRGETAQLSSLGFAPNRGSRGDKQGGDWLVGKACVTPKSLRETFSTPSRLASAAREVELELVNLANGRWLGRLWAHLKVTPKSAVWFDANGIFFAPRITLAVRSCRGYVDGDLPLVLKVEETYKRLCARATALYVQRGRIPKRLRQQLSEVREMRQQFGGSQVHSQERTYRRIPAGGEVASVAHHSTEVVLACVWGGDDDLSNALTSLSAPFAIPSAFQIARRGQGRVAKSAADKDASDAAQTLVNVPALKLSHTLTCTSRSDVATESVRMELRELSSGTVIASGSLELPRCPLRTLLFSSAAEAEMRTVAVSQHIEAPLHQPAYSSESARGYRTPPGCIRSLSTSGGALDMSVTWSVSPVRGDTWLTCLSFLLKGGHDAGGLARPGALMLRFVYSFEGSTFGEREHLVDLPLRLKPLSRRDGDAGGPTMLRRGDEGDPFVFWSGETTRVPHVGQVGGTVKRVELLEVVRVSCVPAVTPLADSQPLLTLRKEEEAYLATRLAVHLWTAEDEQRFRAARRHAQASVSEDAVLWLTCMDASTGELGRPAPEYQVLLGLTTANAVACKAAQLTATRRLRDLQQNGEAAELPTTVAACPRRCVGDVSPSLSARENNVEPVTGDIRALLKRQRAALLPDDRGSVDSGGVVLKSVTFRCPGAALSRKGLTKVLKVTCRVVRDAPRGVRPVSGNKGIHGECQTDAVLEAGAATTIVQEREERGGGERGDAPSSTASLALYKLTAVWDGTAIPLPSSVLAPVTLARLAHLETVTCPSGALLRIQMPTGTATSALCSAPFHRESAVMRAEEACAYEGGGGCAREAHSRLTSTLWEDEFHVEVEVQGSGDDAANALRYASASFTASAVLLHTLSDREVGGLEGDEGGSGSARFATSLPVLRAPLASWIMTLDLLDTSSSSTSTAAMVVVGEQAGDGGDAKDLERSVPIQVDLAWTLDLLGTHPVATTVPGLMHLSAPLSHRHSGAPHGSAEPAAADGEVSASGEEDEYLRQLEAFSAWSDFLASQYGEEELREQQAQLRHWRCAISGVEVAGLALPAWCPNATLTKATRDPNGAVASPTLLAQLVLPSHGSGMAAEEATTIVAARRPRLRDRNQVRSRCPRGARELVMGVARTRASAAAEGAYDIDDDGQLVQSPRPPIAGDAWLRPRHYSATFAPVSWCMAVTDMTAPSAAIVPQGPEVDAAAPHTTPVAGLTVWQLLAAPLTCPSSASGEAVQHSTQPVFHLGGAQLTSLLHEGVFYLTQVLTRWFRASYTTEERDALLRAAAVYPTRWMPLTSLTSSIPQGARLRFCFTYQYHGPVPRPLAESPAHPPTPAGVAQLVHCARLERVDFITDGEGQQPTASDCMAWLSRLVLVLRVVSSQHSTERGTASPSHTVAQWRTRLVPMLSREAQRKDIFNVGRGSATTTASSKPQEFAVNASPSMGPTVPSGKENSKRPPPPIPKPIPARGVLAAPPSPEPLKNDFTPQPAQVQTRQSDEGQGVDKRSAAAALANMFASSPLKQCTPLLPTTRYYCWETFSAEESRLTAAVVQQHSRTPTTAVLRLADIITMEVELVLMDRGTDYDCLSCPTEQCHDGSSDMIHGTVVGRGQGRVDHTVNPHRASGVGVGGGLEHTWWPCAPLRVCMSVSPEAVANAEAWEHQRGVATPPVPLEALPPPPTLAATPTSHWGLSLDFVVLAAPSWAEVTALRASEAARTERQRDTLSALRATESMLQWASLPWLRQPSSSSLSPYSSPTSSFHALDAGGALRAAASPLYRLLRVPPSVLRRSDFSVFDVVRSSHAACGSEVAVAGGDSGGDDRRTRGYSLWAVPGTRRHVLSSFSENVANEAGRGIGQKDVIFEVSSDPFVRHVWLVDDGTGHVWEPQWTLMPTLSPDAVSTVTATNRNNAATLASHLQAGHVLLREAQRLRLNWRRVQAAEPPGVTVTSATVASTLAGLVGGASVSYRATNGDACMWVSGGMRYRNTRETFLPMTMMAMKEAGGEHQCQCFPRRPSLPASTHNSHDRRRHQRRGSQTAAVLSSAADLSGLSSPSCVYDLFVSHFLCCRAGENKNTGPRWWCDVRTPAITNTAAAGALCRMDAVAADAAYMTGFDAGAHLFHTATAVGERIWLLGGWRVADGVAVLPSALELPSDGKGLVERRRGEVRRATISTATSLEKAFSSSKPVAHCEDDAPLPVQEIHTSETLDTHPWHRPLDPAASLAPSLMWCEDVQSVQCMHDGSLAPPVVVPALPELEVGVGEEDGVYAVTPPRLACHVAVSCAERYIVLFGGLLAAGDEAVNSEGVTATGASATAAVHVYDTARGSWAALKPPQTAAAQEQRWPLARYGHSITPVPGTGATDPCSYFVFGGASTTHARCAIVPPEERLWIWTPFACTAHVEAVEKTPVRCVWRSVQLPPELSTALAGRLFSQMTAYTAAEVLAAADAALGTNQVEPSSGDAQNASDKVATTAGPANTGWTSVALCIAGGMTIPDAALQKDCTVPEKSSPSDAFDAFRIFVEPWFAYPVGAVSSVILSSLSKRLKLPPV